MATTLIQLGITDRTALAAARWAAGGEPALADALRRTAMTRLGVQPAVLSTCERLELYALVPSTGGSAFAEAAAHFTDIAGGGPIEIRLGQAAVHAQVRLLVTGQSHRAHGHRPGPRLLGNGRQHAPAVDLPRLRAAGVHAHDLHLGRLRDRVREVCQCGHPYPRRSVGEPGDARA